MGKRIILQEDIDYQISLLKSLSGNEGYKGTQTNLKTTLNNINSSLGKELRGNYVKIISSINSDFDILCDRADATQRLLQNCRDSFVNLDQELRQEVNNNKLDPDLIEGGDKCYIIPGGNSNSSQRILDVEKLKDTDGFRQSEPWGDDYIGTYKGQTINGYQCYAKAKQMQVEVMGSTTFNGIHSHDPGDIQPGDVVHYYYYDKYGNYCQHWIFVLNVKDGILSIGEGNAWDGKQTGVVNYRDISFSEFAEIEDIYRV